MRSLQALALGDPACCPTTCPGGDSTRICCTACPTNCSEVPSTMDPISVSSSQRFCQKAMMKWDPPVSCSPIDRTEIQCQGEDGSFNSLPAIPGAFTAWNIDMGHFDFAPFNLETGDPLLCRVRSHNSIGWSQWSGDSVGFGIPDCSKKTTDDRRMQQNEGCVCRRSCQATGCGGCCKDNHEAGTFWSKVRARTCCATGACSRGCQPKLLRNAMHRHKYCHVHAEDKNRTRKKTRWEMRVVKRKQQVLRPHKTTVKRMVL